MELDDAQKLISQPGLTMKGEWADFGCGDGLFTKALASFLKEGSTIYAVDKNQGSLRNIPNEFSKTIIIKYQADFIQNELPLENLNGILMANSIHFVRNKRKFLQKLNNYMKPHGFILIVEYERSYASPWVPYPIRFNQLTDLLKQVGYKSIEKTGETDSRFGGKIYSVLALFNT